MSAAPAISLSPRPPSVFKSSDCVQPRRVLPLHPSNFTPPSTPTTLSKANLIKGLAAPPAAFQARLLWVKVGHNWDGISY